MKTKTKYKISFCTVCMNRLQYLKKTLPKNIEDNITYGNIEFVVLNYNSKDDLDIWITKEMSHFIEQGILKYVKTREPQFFLMSHSKNVVAKQANGDIICNVDADNFIGKGFAEYINERYRKNKNIYLAVDKKKVQKDCLGRICLRKDDFTKLRGYDESMKGYGFEDFDLRNRLQLIGRKEMLISQKKYLKALTHDDDERLKSEFNNTEIKSIYMKHKTSSTSEVIYCFTDNKAYVGSIVDNKTLNSKSIENLFKANRNFEYQYRLLNNRWELGTYILPNKIVLSDDSTKRIIDVLNDSSYFEILAENYSAMTMFFSQISNRIKMKKNLEQKRITLNQQSYGDVCFE